MKKFLKNENEKSAIQAESKQETAENYDDLLTSELDSYFQDITDLDIDKYMEDFSEEVAEKEPEEKPEIQNEETEEESEIDLDLEFDLELEDEEEDDQEEAPGQKSIPSAARKKPEVDISALLQKIPTQKIAELIKKVPYQKVTQRFNTIPVPGWLFLMGMTLFCECMMHFWVTDEFTFGRFAAVMAFAAGFGCILATFTSFFGWNKTDKWVASILAFLLIVLYLVEYFVADTYQTFMTMDSILNGAEGVATGFSDDVKIVIMRGMGKILLFLLPWALYLLFARSVPKTSWRARYFITLGIAVAYLLGYGIVQGVGTDVSRLKENYNFDSAVRAFGLNAALGLDTVNGGAASEEDDFIIMDIPTPAVPAVTETTPAAEDEEVPEATEPVVYKPHVLDIDFGALAEQESANGRNRVATLHKYVNSLEPAVENEYTGLFEGKNLIMVVAEAFSKEVIDPELTPTLYRLANEGIKFHDYYQPMWAGSTSSGEYSVLTGLVASRGTASVYEATEQDLFFTMGNQLQRLGYSSVAYHNHSADFYGRNETHTHFGYDKFIGMGTGMEKGVKERWPQSDLEMIDFTVEQYIDQQPFSVYYMTVSGHCRYNRGGNKMSGKNYAAVEHLDTSEGVKCYIAANLELEYAMASLVKQLEDAGIADDTVIVLSTDHYPYGLEWDDPKDIERLYGYKYTNIMERDHSALIIWSGCIEDMDLEITAPTYSLDILPTLSNLFGLEYDSRLMVGRDVFSDTEALVLSYTHTWITEKGLYNAEKGKFFPKEGVEVEDDYVKRIAAIVSNKIKYSREAANIDYFNYVSKAAYPEKWEKKK